MTLKSIELNGFKSFGKKSTVSFDSSIVSIVGPNGSGKSNIVESIRFVLGEQSMKSLRGKGGVDLIFKGSSGMDKAKKASVSIVFDNSKKIFSFTNSLSGISLDYDEIKISREVFADGINVYKINDTEVRLKDIIDLLASVNIGASGHHIISQGEADRVLNASSKDRRVMIEDALGLKVYQYRIKESERKLEKTILNMREVGILRKEIAPHLNFLKKQVEKIEKTEALQDELGNLYKDYFFNEANYINLRTKDLKHKRRLLDEKLVSVEDRLNSLIEDKDFVSPNLENIKIKKKEIDDIRKSISELSRTLGRLEGMIDAFKFRDQNQNQSEKNINIDDWNNLISLCESEIDKALASGDVFFIVDILKSLKIKIKEISNKNKDEIKDNNLDKIKDIENEKQTILEKINYLKEKESLSYKDLLDLEIEDKEYESILRESEKLRYELMREKNEIHSDLHSLSYEEEKLNSIQSIFENDTREAQILVGAYVLSYVKNGFENESDLKVDRSSQEELRRKIERIKIKLEDAGVGNSSDVIKEYKDTVDRDQFLQKELEDLDKSIKDLGILIKDLQDTLYSEFKNGIEKINIQFQEFFALMFGGGKASLSVVVENKRIKKEEDEEINEEPKEGIELERGVEINVSLPHKKVRDLHMLSGGERSLTSIALLFAMSQVNPPPFLVLDETDAALDEANSRKYGNMLENLSKYSQLIVVTHNRETMSRAQILYGVTMDSSGASKLLSVKLDDAKAYAK